MFCLMNIWIFSIGFNYRFDSLSSEKPTELNAAFSTLFQAMTGVRFLGTLQATLPVFRLLVRLLISPLTWSHHSPIVITMYIKPWSENNTSIHQAQTAMQRVGRQLLNESKRELMGTGEKGNNWKARDLLSILIRANMASDVPVEQGVSDEDVLDRKLAHALSIRKY
jgi:hypothetical protein